MRPHELATWIGNMTLSETSETNRTKSLWSVTANRKKKRFCDKERLITKSGLRQGLGTPKNPIKEERRRSTMVRNYLWTLHGIIDNSLMNMREHGFDLRVILGFGFWVCYQLNAFCVSSIHLAQSESRRNAHFFRFKAYHKFFIADKLTSSVTC